MFGYLEFGIMVYQMQLLPLIDQIHWRLLYNAENVLRNNGVTFGFLSVSSQDELILY